MGIETPAWQTASALPAFRPAGAPPRTSGSVPPPARPIRLRPGRIACRKCI